MGSLLKIKGTFSNAISSDIEYLKKVDPPYP